MIFVCYHSLMKKYDLSQKMYIVEATAEHLISIVVSGAFLATLTKHLGISDSITGILSSVSTLGCLFQLISLFFQPTRKKPFVIALSIANQLLFVSLYFIPLLNINSTVKIALFVAIIILAYLIYNIAHAKKIAWLMSLVDDSHRGSFTADKEMTSLWVGMVFSFAMGALSDKFIEKGQHTFAFISFAAVMLVLCIVHTVSMLKASESPSSSQSKPNIISALLSVLSNKKMRGVMLTFVLYQIATHTSTPFYSTYLINDLGFSLKTVTAMSIVGSVSRIVVSRFWGRFADKHSFAKMFGRASGLLALAYVAVVFTGPKTAPVLFLAYYILHGMALGGTNSGLINLVFDYAPNDSRADALAVCQAVAGVVGFLSTLALSPLVSIIQKSGNTVFGLPIYAQQLLSVAAVIISVILVLWVKKAFKK